MLVVQSAAKLKCSSEPTARAGKSREVCKSSEAFGSILNSFFASSVPWFARSFRRSWVQKCYSQLKHSLIYVFVDMQLQGTILSYEKTQIVKFLNPLRLSFIGAFFGIVRGWVCALLSACVSHKLCIFLKNGNSMHWSTGKATQTQRAR